MPPAPCVICSCNPGGLTHAKQQHGLEASSTGLVTESLLAQLGHLPSKLSTSSNLVVVDPASASIASSLPPHVQLTRHNRSCSTPEHFHLRASVDQAAALKQLQSSSYFSVQFLEPPNSHAASGQLTQSTFAPSSIGVLTDGGSDLRSALQSSASMAYNSSLLKTGVPLLKLGGVS